jgi:hypothetical protein
MNNLKHKIKWFIIKLNIFKYTFHSIEGFVYVDTNRKPVNDITGEVRWLGTVDVHCRYKDAHKKAIEALGELYPRYKGYINVF